MSIKFWALALAAVVATGGSAAAQTAASLPPVGVAADGPELFFGFFHLQIAINEAFRTNPSVAPAAARMMGLRDVDFAVLTRIAVSASSELEGIRARETAALSNAAATRREGIATRFDAERRIALVKGIESLERELPTASWTALRNYVNGPYLRSIHTQIVAAK